jgi:Cu+-exporting ATPase
MSPTSDPELSRRLHIAGMTCASCQAHVQRALAAVPGVSSARVNLLAHTAAVDAVPGTTTQALVAAVRSAGYDASLSPPEQAQAPSDTGLRAVLALAAGVLAMLASNKSADPLLAFVARHLDPLMPAALMRLPASPLRYGLAALTVAVMLFAARDIYAAAWRAARHRATNMNTLVAIGTLAALASSLGITIAPVAAARNGFGGDVYFEAVIFILAFLLLGRWLEERARSSASAAIEGFARLEASQARVVGFGSPPPDMATAPETLVPLDAVEAGDFLRLLPGDRVPVDGEVVSGRSAIDASMLTGEPLPVTRNPGDKVAAGTLNIDGVLVIRATGVSAASTLTQMRRLLEQAQNSRAPLEGIADRASSIFVPCVLGFSGITFAAWAVALNVGGRHEGFARPLAVAIAVLIVACPCAMGLAVPAAMTVALGRAARLGLLLKGGEALERLATVNTIAFDKTGTLTEGRPRIAAMVLASDARCDRQSLLAIAAAVERLSTHPLAQAVVAFAAESGMTVPMPTVADVRVLPGVGVRAVVGGRSAAMGNGSILPADTTPMGRATSLSQATPVYLVVEDHLEAALYALDTLRPEASEAVRQLRSLGIEPVMLTGDIADSAETIAAQAGIRDIRAHLLPQEKVAAIRDLQQQGRRVAMAGDGINDAAALAQADAGLALASGSDLAREAGDAVLLHPDLRLLPAAIRLARRTTRIMRQNLGWAIAYNAIGLPIAAGAFYPHFHVLLSPVLASAAMALSSVSVLANSLRLRRA